MVIREQNGRVLNFFSSAVASIIGLVVLSLGAYLLAALDFVFPFLPPDNIMATILLNLGGQVLVAVSVLFLVIPLLHLQTVEHRPLTVLRTLKSVPVFCLSYAIASFAGIALRLLFEGFLGMPVESSYGSILLTPVQLANPVNLVIFFATATFGAAISEELVFRRTVIPSLEAHGMGPLAAVLASSLGFSLIHMPNDIMNGSFAFVISHFTTALIIGILLGISYVVTRNVIFPMIMHGLVNLVSFSVQIAPAIDNFSLTIALGLIILAIWAAGTIVSIIALWQVLKTKPAAWSNVLRIRSKVNVFPGLLGYLVVAVLLVSLETLGRLGLFFLLIPNIPLIYAAICSFYLLYVALLLWLLTQTRYKEAPAPETEPMKF